MRLILHILRIIFYHICSDKCSGMYHYIHPSILYIYQYNSLYTNFHMFLYMWSDNRKYKSLYIPLYNYSHNRFHSPLALRQHELYSEYLL